MDYATSLDENNQIYLVAIGIIDLDNDASWEWFMTNFRGVIRYILELAFIYDCCMSIQKAVYRVMYDFACLS